MRHPAYNKHLKKDHKCMENINKWIQDEKIKLDKTFDSESKTCANIWNWNYFYAWALSKKNDDKKIDENENNNKIDDNENNNKIDENENNNKN